MSELAVDLFKFVALRSPGDADPGAVALRFLRDPRLTFVEHYPVPRVDQDADEFAGSPAAALIHDRVRGVLVGLPAPVNVPAANRSVATAFALEPLVPPPPSGARLAAIVKSVAGVEFATLDAVFDAAGTALATAGVAKLDNYFTAAVGATAPAIVDRDAAFDALYRAYVAKQVRSINLDAWLAAIRSICGLLGVRAGRAPAAPGLANVGRITTIEQFRAVQQATPVLHPMFSLLASYYQPFNTVAPVGIGDLLVVKQFLRAYEPGEIAHVENVLKSELKSRTHRVLDRLEESFTRETETTEETVRELQTTERFELKSETESTIQTDLNAEMSGQVSGRYGVVEVSASAGVSYSQSNEDSRRSSNNFAKDVIDRSLSRIQTRVREERTARQTHEVEETNVHELDNRSGTGNVTGVYRWLDKHYTAQVYNYGKRLMFEFVLPEPAAFVIQAFERSKNLDSLPKIPQPPAKPNLVLSDISQATVDAYADIFPLGNLKPQPAETASVSKAITASGVGGQTATAQEKQFDVPEGYVVTSADISGSFEGVNVVAQGHDWGVFISLGGQTVDHQTPSNTGDWFHQTIPNKHLDFSGSPLVGSPTAAVLGYRVVAFEVTIVLNLERTSQALRQWQIDAYDAIMDAYGKALSTYESQLTEYRDRLEGYKVGQGVVIRGRNERINQDIIRTELKKGCLAMVALQFDADRTDDVVFDSMKSRTEQIPETSVVRTETTTETTTNPQPGVSVKVTTTTLSDDVSTVNAPIAIPSIDVPDATDEGRLVQFLEQAFEWQQMTYVLYPYFWGKLPEKWFDAQRYYDEEDPLFARFLQSGSVRVLVAARPGFEMAVMHYLRTRQPWNGGPTPGLDSDLYLAVHEELRDQQDDLNGAVPYGDPWEVVVPTSLVWLQADATLPVFDVGGTGHGSGTELSELWTGSAHQATLSTLASNQTAWTDWPAVATWQVPVPTWASEVDVNFALNPGIVFGDVWGELRLDIGGGLTEPAMFDVNYTDNAAHNPEQAVMMIGDTHPIAPEIRGTTITVTLQGRMLDPAHHPGWLEANRGCHINGQLNFKSRPS